MLSAVNKDRQFVFYMLWQWQPMKAEKKNMTLSYVVHSHQSFSKPNTVPKYFIVNKYKI